MKFWGIQAQRPPPPEPRGEGSKKGPSLKIFGSMMHTPKGEEKTNTSTRKETKKQNKKKEKEKNSTNRDRKRR